MSAHVTQWIAAYYDGELDGARRKRVEEHLSQCTTCREELEDLRRLSSALQSVPVAAPTFSPEHFAARVRVRLPHTAARTGWQATWKVAWQAAPLLLIAGWVFTQAILSLSSLATLAGMTASLSTGQGMLPSLGSAFSGMFWLNRLVSLLSPFPWLGPAGLVLAWVFLTLGSFLFTGMLLWGWVAGWWASKRSAVFITSEVSKERL